MATTLNAKILLKRGAGSPGTTLELGELGYDTSNNLLYIGMGVGETPDGFVVPDVTKAYVDGSLNRKLGIAAVTDTSTATQMRFDRTLGLIYGTINTPLTGAITMSASDALVGVVSLAIHKDNSTGVAVPVTFKKLAGTYDGSVNNFIYVQYIDASNQLYTINKVS